MVIAFSAKNIFEKKTVLEVRDIITLERDLKTYILLQKYSPYRTLSFSLSLSVFSLPSSNSRKIYV
jgi:hypothetical protein